MTERKKLSLNRPRKVSPKEQTSSNPVYGKKVWVNAVPKKQVKKPKPQKVAKPQLKKVVKKPILNKLQDARQDRERGLLFVSSAR